MAEAKWVKILIRMFEDPKLKIINSMKDRDCICYVWVRSIMLAGLCNRNGYLCINDNIPYSLDMISIMFDRNTEDVKKAYEVLMQLEMIEKTEEGIFKVKNWSRYQNIEGLDKLKKQNAERVAKYRRKKKAESSAVSNEELEEEEKKQQDNDGNDREIKSNVCNITRNEDIEKVMVQNKRENEKEEIKIKNIERDSNNCNEKEREDLELEIKKLEDYFKEITGDIKNINTATIKYAVLKHGPDYVKLAMDKAVESGKVSMTYINGILRNWGKEGYPNLSMGEGINGGRVIKKDSGDNKKQFGKIKKKKARRLTESEQREAVNLE